MLPNTEQMLHLRLSFEPGKATPEISLPETLDGYDGALKPPSFRMLNSEGYSVQLRSDGFRYELNNTRVMGGVIQGEAGTNGVKLKLHWSLND